MYLDPVRCTFIKKWRKKCDDDSETSNWISANTKVLLLDAILSINYLGSPICILDIKYSFLYF